MILQLMYCIKEVWKVKKGLMPAERLRCRQMQISGQDMERVKAMKGGREQAMDELWRDCGELHNYT